MSDAKPKMILHVCCAPCGTHPFQILKKAFDVHVFFYNPNIHPLEEYEARVDEIKRLSEKWHFSLTIGPTDMKAWFQSIRGFENEPEGGKRCDICFRMRFEKTAQLVSEIKAEYFTTTLSISPHKNAEIINRLGDEAAAKYGLAFYHANFKKQNGFKISCDLSKQEGLYRQNYCGCVYSRREIKQRGKKR